MTSIIVASFHAEDAKNIRDMLTRNGFRVNIVCTSGAQILAQAQSLQGGIVICSYKLTDMIYERVAENLPSSFQMILLASMRVLGDVVPQGCSHIPIPFKLHELLETVDQMMQTQMRLARKMRQMPKKRSEEEVRILNEAKQLLMEKRKLTEDEAHRMIQRRSMESQTTLVEMAKMVLTLYQDPQVTDNRQELLT